MIGLDLRLGYAECYFKNLCKVTEKINMGTEIIRALT